MVDPSSLELPGEFELLGNKTRLQIIYALIEHRRENPHNPSLTFTTLRERAGIRDSGNFNYHLNQLRGQFIEESGDGYQLTCAGESVGGAILSGTYSGGRRREPVAIGASCPGCEAQVMSEYEDGLFIVECENDHLLFKTYLPPGAVEGRLMSELLTLGTMTTHHGMELSKEGTCPQCYGSMVGTLAEIEHGEYAFYGFEAVCERCGMLYKSSVGLSVVRHPAVVALYQNHGLDIRKQPPWTLDFMMGRDPITVTATDPLRVRVDVQLDTDELRLTLNDEASVIDIEYAE